MGTGDSRANSSVRCERGAGHSCRRGIRGTGSALAAMILEFLPDASAELYAAAEYYELKQEGLGRRFRDEVLQVCGLIVQQPLLWRERAGGYRRVNCPVF